MNFKVKVVVREDDSQQARRAADLSPAFDRIIDAWVSGNRGKFEAAQGAEQSGLGFSTTTWKPVTEKYYRQKHGPIIRGSRKLYADWLMRRTGSLMESMTARGAMEEAISERTAYFGVPKDSDDLEKITGNFGKRNVIFLSEDDVKSINFLVRDYIAGVGEFSSHKIPRTTEYEGQ